MATPYDKYKINHEWKNIEQSIQDLIDNNDIEIKTANDYVVGYITKQVIDKKEDISLRTNVILSANRALWGSVTKDLRGVTVDYNNDLLTLRAYFDKGATNEDKDLIDEALIEIEADLYPRISKFNYETIDLFWPSKMDVLKDWIYVRYEKND